jgi:hypothetical protein
MKVVGVIHFWHAKKRFGFINAQTRSGEINRYFLSPRNIQFFAGGVVIGVGCGVLFNVNPPRREGDYPFATDIEVYQDEAQAFAAGIDGGLVNAE